MIEPFRYEFFVNGAIVATIAGALCGLVGVFVVLRGMSYVGHGLSHAVFGWAVASFLTGVNFYVGAGVGGFASAFAIGAIARRREIKADAAIGVVTTAMFAVGLALMSRYRSFTRDFDAALFGNVLGTDTLDLVVVAGAGTIISLIVLARYRLLLFTTFDPDVADVFGVSTRKGDLLFSALLAGTVVVTMQALGVTLIAAALVIPPVVARMVVHRFARVLAVSTGLGGACGFVGIYISYFLNIASGPSIVLTASAMFLIVFAATGAAGRR